ncbi:DAZ-associated protein 1 [Echinococcus granulosus]|nr:DAZ-associated protein 1 [Echinococcus granulosus]
MASADTDLICGVCTNLMSDPYSPPCGHTFCLRPCLLPHARAMTARCIRCHATFDLAELRPNYTIAAKLTLISMKREPQQDQMPKQQAKNKGDCVEEMSIGERRIRENPPFSMRCSTCRRPVGAKEVDTCHHCHCNICSQCREKHRDSFSLMVRVKLNALSRHKAMLKSRLEQLQGPDSSSVETLRKSKGGVFGAMEDAVLELRMAASKSLDAATAKLEMVDMNGFEMIGPLVRQITDLFVEVNKTQDVFVSLERISSLQELVAKQKSLSRLLDEAAPLKEMIRNLPPLPITQLHLSDRISKIDQHLSNFNLVMGDGVMSLPQLLRLAPLYDIGNESKNVASPNTAATKSRVKLYVAGLRPNYTEGQLQRYFAQYGAITDCCIARDHKTKESRGFGFVTFREEAHATRALAGRPHFIEGSPISVRPFILKAKKEKTMPVSSSAKKAAPSSGDKSSHQLIVHDLPHPPKKKDIQELFSQFGTVTKVKIDLAAHKALVDFSTSEAIQMAMAATSLRLKDVNLRVSLPDGHKKAAPSSCKETGHLLVVHNLPLSTRKKTIQKLFSRFGKITKVKIDQTEHKAFVDFSTPEAIQMAMTATSLRLKDVDLRVSLPDDK